MIASGYVKRGRAVAVLGAALAGCDLIPNQGYAKLTHRVRDPIEIASHPPPPPARPGLLGGGASAVPQLPAGAPAGVTQAMVEQGAQQFGTVCSACHGPGGQGTAAAPKLADGQWINISGTYDEIDHIITTGVPNPKEHPAPMPPRGGGSFTDEQVRQLAAYVFAISHQSP
jgi:mono/diheme cytochrome c family protein